MARTIQETPALKGKLAITFLSDIQKLREKKISLEALAKLKENSEKLRAIAKLLNETDRF